MFAVSRIEAKFQKYASDQSLQVCLFSHLPLNKNNDALKYESSLKQIEYPTWHALVNARVQDATRRSKSRGCGQEKSEQLQIEAMKLLKKQKYLCALCGNKLTKLKNDSKTASLDRIYSSVKPSPDRKNMCSYLHNCRWVCWSCNHKTRHCHMPDAKFGNKNECQ